MSLEAASNLSDDPKIIFAVLVHDLGKALTPENILPSHRGHEKKGLVPIKNLCERLGVPTSYKKFALKVCEYHLHSHRALELKPETVLKVIEAFDGFRNPDQIDDFLVCCLADIRGRTGQEENQYLQSDRFKAYHRAASQIDEASIAEKIKRKDCTNENPGNQIRKEIRRKRIEAIRQIKLSS